MTKNSNRTFVHICVVISTMDLQLPQTNMTGVAIIGNNDQLENYWTTYRMYMCVCQQQKYTIQQIQNTVAISLFNILVANQQ